MSSQTNPRAFTISLQILNLDYAAKPGPSLRSKIKDHAVLYLIPESTRVNLPRVRLHTLAHGIPRVALPPVRLHAADAARPRTTLAPNALVQQIVNSTSQASWFQFVRDLSGDSDV